MAAAWLVVEGVVVTVRERVWVRLAVSLRVVDSVADGVGVAVRERVWVRLAVPLRVSDGVAVGVAVAVWDDVGAGSGPAPASHWKACPPPMLVAGNTHVIAFPVRSPCPGCRTPWGGVR